MRSIKVARQSGGEESKVGHSINGWTISLKSYYDKVHELEERINQERDRRYEEVSKEREKALKIKEEADKAALALAREIQTYKDEKANELREQIASERNLYVTKPEVDSVIRELKAQYQVTSHFSVQQAIAIIGLIVAAAAGAVLYFK